MHRIKKLDVIDVYPKGHNKGPKNYFGKKWAVIKFELVMKGEVIEGLIDVPLPKDCDDIHPVAADAINKAVSRGTLEAAADYVLAA